MLQFLDTMSVLQVLRRVLVFQFLVRVMVFQVLFRVCHTKSYRQQQLNIWEQNVPTVMIVEI